MTRRYHLIGGILVLLVSIGVLWYFMSYIIPYGEKIGILSEADEPTIRISNKFIRVSAPVLIGYFIFLIIPYIVFKVRMLSAINFPLIIINVYLLTFACLIALSGGAIIWMMIFSAWILLIVIVLSIIAGLKWDDHRETE